MYIDTLKISGFRGFKHYEALFCPKTNVLIGRNGTGKTTLIHAVIKALSFVFSNDKSMGREFLSAGNNTLNVRGYNTSDFHFDEAKRTYVSEVSIQAKGAFCEHELTWELFKRNTPNSSLYPSLYKEAFTAFMACAKQEGTNWPLLAYYSDSYPHVYSKIMNTTLKVISRPLRISFSVDIQ